MLAVPEKVGMRWFGIHIGTERILIYEGEKKYFLDSNTGGKIFNRIGIDLRILKN